MAIYATESLTSATQSVAVPVNYNENANNPITVVLDFTTGTGVGTASVQFSLEPIGNPNPLWFTANNLSALTATAVVPINYAVRQVRLNVTAYTSGTISMRILQGDTAE